MSINLYQRFRIVFESRDFYRVIDENNQVLAAQIAGSIRNGEGLWPAVGDWVNGRMQPGDWVVIDEVLPRSSVLQRKDQGQHGAQILATNVDVLFIVTSANDDFNLNRLDRYVAMASGGDVQPVIIINKIELTAEPESYIQQVQERFVNIAVHGLSFFAAENLKVLDFYAEKNKTLAFVGSSGVGKSSLTNYLVGDFSMQTNGIRESDGRGRHTTTHRELLLSASGAFVIDTPGLRSLALVDSEGLENTFADLEALSLTCKFKDCRHESEPQCAVKQALTEGSLSDSRWQSYNKLRRELSFEMRKQQKALLLDAKESLSKKKLQKSKRLKFTE